jgi:hypothetical protein
MRNKLSVWAALCLIAAKQVLSSQYVQWEIDPRCPEDDDRRHLKEPEDEANEAVTGNLRHLFPLTENQLDVADSTKALGDDRNRNLFVGSTNPVTFNFKLHWEQGYCWQREWGERKWCLECPQITCGEGDFLWINECNEYEPLQRFEWIQLGIDPNSGQNQGLLKVASQNLCIEQVSPNTFRLQTCDENNIDQKLIGFHFTLYFQIGPAHVDYLYDCLTQDHHPKPYEELISQACDVAQKHRTGFWEVYKPSESVVSLRMPSCTSQLPCQECQGDCNRDSDCLGTLRCFERGHLNAAASIPGCAGVPLASCK